MVVEEDPVQRNPCLTCPVHLAGGDKQFDPRCERCEARQRYADQFGPAGVGGVPLGITDLGRRIAVVAPQGRVGCEMPGSAAEAVEDAPKRRRAVEDVDFAACAAAARMIRIACAAAEIGVWELQFARGDPKVNAVRASLAVTLNGYRYKFTQAEIGALIGIDQSAVSRLLRKER